MYDLLEKILESAILLIIWCNGIFGDNLKSKNVLTNIINGPNSMSEQRLIIEHILKNRNITAQPSAKVYNVIHKFNKSIKNHSDRSRSYYSSVPATSYIPAFDPISVLASLAFLAFLLQSFAALFDRTRSIIPTIISSRQSNSKYEEQFVDIENIILRALDEYASLNNNLVENGKDKKSVP